MLSDESSSDSETGRFKCQSKPKEEQSSRQRDGDFRGRGRPSQNDRFRRDFGRQKDERFDYDKHTRDRHRSSRHSPVNRRKNSRDRSPRRRSPERQRERDPNARSRHHRSTSKEKTISSSRSHKSPERSKTLKSPEPKSRIQKSPEPRPKPQRSPETRTRIHRSPEPRPKVRYSEPRSRPQKSPEPRARSHKSPDLRGKSHKSPEPRRDMKEEIRRTLAQSRKSPSKSRRSEERVSLSPDYRSKRSEVVRPPPSAPLKRKSKSPIIVEEHESDKSEEVQVGSYYKMIPTVVKEKSEEESSEIDSSDDERLRAKLLNLEKELQKTKKKKHKKKHKRKSKSSKEDDAATSVEVTSTTDIDVKDGSSKESPVPEVSSTQKSVLKESSEEGEISSGDETQDSQEQYDPSDLRHKLSRKPETTSKADASGPVIPPRLVNKQRGSSLDREGPALPPHLTKSKNIGPSIPENMRKVLAEKDCEVIEYESSEDDGIGPLPVGAEPRWSEAHQRLEERALDLKIRKLDGRSLESDKIKNREEWMLELPEGKTKYLGLEARSFRAKAGPDMSDRSSWTDTPDEKAKKAAGIIKEEDTDEAIKRDARARLINNRDVEQEMAIKKHKKKHRRDESLLELHERKIKKKKKKEEKDNDGQPTRRPFSRDVDLQVNRFDEAQKKSIIKKAEGLNTRFSRGEAKYL